MASYLDYLFPPQANQITGLLGGDDEKMRAAAQRSGLLGAGLGMIAASGPSRMPQGILQPLATGLMAGQQAYQGTLDKQTQDQINAAKFAETKRQMDVRQLLPQLYAETTDAQGNVTRQINKDVFQKIALQNPELAKQISEGQIAGRKAGLLPGMETNAPSPFAPYLQATSPQVRTMAQQLERGFQSGIIDEETAYKRIDALAKMEDQFTGRQESKADRALTRDIARQAKEAQGTKFTEEENKAAGFADRMALSTATLSNIEAGVAKKQLEGKETSEPYASTVMQTAGGVPFIGGYLRNKVSSPEQRQYRQAQENWVRANLRKESGAVIGADEMDAEIAVYFPMPNDDPQTIQQKKVNRMVTEDAMRKAAGRAYQPFNLETFKKSRGLE